MQYKNYSKKVQVSIEKFLERAHTIHGEKYDYSSVKFEKMKDIIDILCPIHGLFKQTVDVHLNMKCGCPKCSNERTALNSRKTNAEFINESNEVHNNSYDYSKTLYTTNNNKVTIICPTHGEFQQLPYNHLAGKGCNLCKLDGVFSKKGFITAAKNKECIFYILKCFSAEEVFYKIGITSNSIKSRYCSKIQMPYQYELVLEKKGKASDIWDLERTYKFILREYKFIPSKSFNGSRTECFTSVDFLLPLE